MCENLLNICRTCECELIHYIWVESLRCQQCYNMANTKKASWLLGFGAQDNSGIVMATKDVTTLQKKDMVMMFESRCNSNGIVLFNMEKTMMQGFKGVCHKV